MNLSRVAEWCGNPVEVTARFIPKFLWTTASIDVLVDSRCVLRTGGKWKIVGTSAARFDHAGSIHDIELTWGLCPLRSFSIKIKIDRELIADTRVLVSNWPTSLWPVAAFLVWFGWAVVHL